jgi:hypothetical protein
MGNVFANGLEISGAGSDGKTIAAFPDTCFTPPENPATPPGVPVPYPSFGFSSDTDEGTGTVKISDKTVNIKNQSFLSKTSGTEAGCAAKKGIITSTNTGKEYFQSWSNNVKFDGEPVIRFTDLATNNHASLAANQSAPWYHILFRDGAETACWVLLQDHNLRLHPHNQANCPDGYESEHYVGNEYFQHDREHNQSYKQWKNYSQHRAPCVCIRAKKHAQGGGFQHKGPGSKVNTPHDLKTKRLNQYKERLAKRGQKPKLKGVVAQGADAIVNTHKETKAADPDTKKEIAKCLRAIFMAYIEDAVHPPKSRETLNNMTTMSHTS